MIKSFADEGTKDIFHGRLSAKARKKLTPALWKIARRKLDMINSVNKIEDLKTPPGNRLELLKGKFKGKYSIRINEQWRIIFAWSADSPSEVEIIDYHRG